MARKVRLRGLRPHHHSHHESVDGPEPLVKVDAVRHNVADIDFVVPGGQSCRLKPSPQARAASGRPARVPGTTSFQRQITGTRPWGTGRRSACP